MTSRLDDKIRAFVSELVDDPPPAPEIDFEWLGRPDHPPLHESPSRRRPWLPAVAVVGAALLVMVAVGLPILFFGGRDSIVIDQPTTTVAPVPTTLPPTTLPPSPVVTLDSWKRVGADVMQPVVGLFDMTQVGSRLIAVGFDPGEEDRRQNGVIFASDDGVTWTRLAEDDPALTMGAVLIYGIAEGGPGLVAVGTGCEDNTAPCAPHPTVWTSADGTSWTRSATDPDIFGESGAMMDLAATDYGIVAAGNIAELGADDGFFVRPAVWLSPDGADWSRVWEGDLVDAGASSFVPGFTALAVDSEGLIVGVGSAENEDSQVVAAVWISTDGRAWERIESNSPAFGSETDLDVTILEVTWGSDGFIAVGTEGGTHVAIWKSADGLSWTRIDTTDQPFGTTGTLSAVAALDTGFVATGPHGFAGPGGKLVTLWTSPDGSSWDRVQTLGPGYAMAIVVTDVRIAAAGATPDANDFHAAVWAGPLFDPDAPPPDPLPSSPPTTVEETSTDLDEIGELEEGLSCEELATSGYSYAEVVTYWTRYQMSTDLDLDGNGLPCEDEYPASDVHDVYSGPEAIAVRMFSDGSAMTFLATGPAVDADIVCPTGTNEGWAQRDAIRDRSLVRWEDVFTCDDGSGIFVVGLEVFDGTSSMSWGVWDIASGTGIYESLTGGGRVNVYLGYPDVDMTGRLWFVTDEN